MRLIDADLFEVVTAKGVSEDFASGMQYILEKIDATPTAFDLEAVVKRLEEESSFFEGKPMGTLQKHYYCEGIKRAIKIIKEGLK